MSDQKRFDAIDSKLDKITEHIGSIDVTLAKQAVSLDTHIQRTKQIEDELLPIKKHVNRVQGAIMFLLGVGSIWAIIQFLVKK